MKCKDHRLGVSEVNLMTRHPALVTSIDTSKLNVAITEIDQPYGLDNVAFDEKSTRLDLSYDASRLCIQYVEDIFLKYAIQPRHDWWTRFKEAYYRFINQNVKDNARHEPCRCHRTPRHTRK